MITSLTLIIGLGEFAHRVFSVISKQTFRIPYHHVELVFLPKKTQMCMQCSSRNWVTWLYGWIQSDVGRKMVQSRHSECSHLFIVVNLTQPINWLVLIHFSKLIITWMINVKFLQLLSSLFESFSQPIYQLFPSLHKQYCYYYYLYDYVFLI